MGNTCASLHIAWRGAADDAAKAISRSYRKLGYERLKKAPAAGGKHVVMLPPAGQSYVSLYDSENAQLDSGELKDLAMAASKALKTAAVFTSLYDSDTYEFIVFANGRQIDLLMTDAESYEGPMKRLGDKSRAAKWSSLFGRPLTTEQIQQALALQTPFADDIVAGLSELIGLRDGRAQINYQDLLEAKQQIAAEFYLKKSEKPQSDIPAGEIRLRDYFDPDNCRMRSVYPASWPVPIGKQRLATWLILSEGEGFSGGTVGIRLSGRGTLLLPRAIISGFKFHNGQVVGSLEPVAPNLTQEDLIKLVDEKRFPITPVESSQGELGLYGGEFPSLVIPPMTPARTTQILLIFQMDMEPKSEGEWEINLSIRPGAQTEYQHKLPPLRVAAVDQQWLPVVSGLNPKTRYDKSNLGPTHLRELAYKQSTVPEQRLLEHPAITSSVVILQDDGQPALDACRAWFEEWLRPLAEQPEGEIRIHAEKQMTESAYVGKTRKTLPVSGFLRDKVWGKLFDAANDYQTALVTFFPKGAECAIAGIGLQHSFQEFRRDEEHAAKLVSDTLTAMRGRTFDVSSPGGTWHIFKWLVHQEDCYKFLGATAAEMQKQLDDFAAERQPLQAWSSQCTWIPEFDHANDYERTVYEDASVLNWFRGIFATDNGLNAVKMTAEWCRNVLRMVAPQLWLCRNLMDQVDRSALERVAEIGETNGMYKVTVRAGCRLDDLELALLPILPVESARISVL